VGTVADGRGFVKRLILVVAVFAAGCVPGTNPPAPFSHADGWAAVDLAFGDLGPTITQCAHDIAARESNHNPYAGLAKRGHRHFGVFQLHDGFKVSYPRAVNDLGARGFLGHWPNVFDPYVNALAARYGFDAAGGSFRRNWATTTPGGCP